MKAKMMVFAATSPARTEIVELPVPVPGPGEALVKIECCVPCNTTDRYIIDSSFGTGEFPVLVGHESIGTVVQLGDGVQKLSVGDRVPRANAIGRDFAHGFYSKWGGFAEYGLVKDQEPVASLKLLTLEQAGLMIALSETASCLMQLGDIHGKRVLVTGTGIAGYTLVYFAKHFGASNVVCLGRRMSRLQTALRMGADEVYVDGSPEWENVRNRRDADFIFEATGNSRIFAKGVPMLGKEGLLAFYGVAEEPYHIPEGEAVRRMTFTPREEMAYAMVCDLLLQDRSIVENLLTHRWDFTQIQRAFDEVRSGEVIKGIVVME